MIETIHKFEKAVVTLLNFDGWNLEHTGENYEYYDAKGTTPKGIQCVMEMKFRKTYYDTKIIEKAKFDKLIKHDAAFYLVSDPKGTYIFWLNDLKDLKETQMYCPDTTLWTKKKVLKPCYLLKENQAVLIDYLNEKKGVWDDYFNRHKK